jgi:hypothetical protein
MWAIDMDGSETMNAGPVDAKAVCDEIVAAFGDVPRPDLYIRFSPYEDEAERLHYLVGKTWIDIARDLKYLVLHSSDDFFYMTDECFLYFFPGYLLGVVNHKFVFVDGLAYSLLEVLSPHYREEEVKERALYLSARLTPCQKKAVAHWIQLELERDRERRPEVYERGVETDYQGAFDKWREWA